MPPKNQLSKRQHKLLFFHNMISIFNEYEQLLATKSLEGCVNLASFYRTVLIRFPVDSEISPCSPPSASRLYPSSSHIRRVESAPPISSASLRTHSGHSLVRRRRGIKESVRARPWWRTDGRRKEERSGTRKRCGTSGFNTEICCRSPHLNRFIL